MSTLPAQIGDPSETLSVDVARCGLRHYPRDWGLRPSPMKHNVLLYFMRGRGMFECEGVRLDADAGDLFFLKSGHAYLADGDPEHATTVYNILFTIHGAGRHDLLRPLRLPFRMRLRLQDRRALERLLAQLALEFEAYRDPALAQRLAIRGSMLLLLAEVLRLAAAVPEPLKTPGPEPLLDPLSEFAAVLSHIEARLAEPLDVAGLAELMHLSPNHFSTQFRRRMGKPPMEYVRQRRMAVARELLLATEKSVKEIAKEVGYPDRFLFSRVFKRLVGTPPNALREAYKNPFSP
ncbi:MAG: AraC family transcriptional regulator [Planctomycetota bacterium]|nr:AraC family transcriptional regulator [Planctomycetota bacterium]